MSRWPASLVILGCLASPLTPAADSLECMLAKSGWSSQRDAGDLKAAARSFATLARKCPAAMQGGAGKATASFLAQLRGPSLRESRGEVLEALFAGNYQDDSGGEPAFWWVELIGRKLERKDFDGARAVLARVDAFEALLAMQVDRRFDELRKAAPERFDLDAAVRRELALLRARVDANPKSLEARCVLAWRLVEVGRFPDGLALMDSALAAGPQLFDDWKDQQPWVMTTRGFAQYGAGQFPQALELFIEADASTRDRRDHATFTGNLALMQIRLGKADDALASLRSLGQANPSGELLTSSISHRAYVLKGDTIRAEQILSRMQELAPEKLAMYLEALLRAGKVDAAKYDLLEKLNDPEQRTAALLFVQTFRNPQLTAEQRPVAQRKQQLLALPEVRKAIQEVGRAESFNFPEP